MGLAPWSRDSGGQRGYRSIRGGRGAVRRVLYLSALSAIRHNEEMGRYYRGLRERGKAGKVALVAVMRKLLLLLNAIVPTGNGVQQQSPRRSIELDSQHRYSSDEGWNPGPRVRVRNGTKCEPNATELKVSPLLAIPEPPLRHSSEGWNPVCSSLPGVNQAKSGHIGPGYGGSTHS